MIRAIRISIFLVSIILFLFFLYIKLNSSASYKLLTQEDSTLEYLQSLFYLLASILAFIISFQFLRSNFSTHAILYFLLAICLFLISGEEISWGQRIFDINLPKYFEKNNLQEEITIHNLNSVQPRISSIYKIIGIYGTFAWLIVMSIDTKVKLKNCNIIKFIVPDWSLSLYFFSIFLIYYLLQFRTTEGGFLRDRDQEPAEFLLSLGFLFFVVINFTKTQTCLNLEKKAPPD